jgi:cell division septum initiation protein DivIVA
MQGIVPTEPGDISLSGLPRSLFGGIKADAAERLLAEAAWHYREVLGRNNQLERALAELTQRAQELEAQVASLEEGAAGRKDRDELARVLLASAERHARKLRESAREDCELMLRKARSRALEVEAKAQQRVQACASELAQLEALRTDVMMALSAFRESIVELAGMAEFAEDGLVEPSAAWQDIMASRAPLAGR